MGLYMESNAGGYSPGRMDQNLYPYYKRDVEAGILTDAEALELIECMWIKFGEQIWYWNEPAATHYAGFCAFQNVCIGGVDMDGLDAVNPLSYLMLQATIDTQMVQPSLSVRLSRKEFDMMEMLMLNQKLVITKEKLLLKVWGYESDAEDNNVEVYISFLRKKLEHLRSQVKIRTIRMVGYCLEAPDGE